MEKKISTTELARNLRDVLGRIRYLGESITVERSGTPVARRYPVRARPATLGEAFAAWKEAVGEDPGFADDLERVNTSDAPPESPLEPCGE